MKLIIAVVHREDSEKLVTALNAEKYYVTKLASTGGFLRAGNVTLMVGTEEENVDHVIDIIDEKCHSRTELSVPTTIYSGMPPIFPVEVKVGGATVFVLDIDRFERL